MNNINAIFGPYFENGHFEYKEFPFNAFVFPACEECNNGFSQIESNTKIIIEKIIRKESLNSSELNYLLSWFDKLRVGLRSALFIMKKQNDRIEKNFSINYNIQSKDRVLLIYKNKDCVDDLTIICAILPVPRSNLQF